MIVVVKTLNGTRIDVQCDYDNPTTGHVKEKLSEIIKIPPIMMKVGLKMFYLSSVNYIIIKSSDDKVSLKKIWADSTY